MFSFILYTWEKAEGNVVLKILIYLAWFVVQWVYTQCCLIQQGVAVTVKQETVDWRYPKMCGDQRPSAPTWHGSSTGLTNMYPTEKYDEAYSHFDIHKVLLSCYFYCIIHPRNHAKLCTRTVVIPYLPVHCKTYKWRMARKCGVLCCGTDVELCFKFEPQPVLSLTGLH
jgi:hypothetical protein